MADLINTYERHIAETAISAIKVELYFQIAQVYADEVGDVDRAIDAYRNIVDLDDLNVPALDALSRHRTRSRATRPRPSTR